MAGIERPRLFLDADVLIAGSASTTGASHLVLRLGQLGLVDLVSSAQARTEAERNIASKLPAALATFRLIVKEACRFVPDPRANVISSFKGQGDPKDLPLLAAAVSAACQSLVTFNIRHYRPKRGTIRIEAPGQLVARLRRLLVGLADD